MEEKNWFGGRMSEMVIDVDGFLCRICHGADKNENLECPCCCSGSMKFAHRDCVQKWCNAKGNTTCEICFQKFEPGYTCPPQKPVLVPSIRSRPNLIRSETESEDEEGNEVEYSYDAFYSRNAAIIVNVVLLVINMSAVFDNATYPLPIFAVVAGRACGIFIPMYVLFKFASTIENAIRHCYQVHDTQEQRSVTIQIHTP